MKLSDASDGIRTLHRLSLNGEAEENFANPLHLLEFGANPDITGASTLSANPVCVTHHCRPRCCPPSKSRRSPWQTRDLCGPLEASGEEVITEDTHHSDSCNRRQTQNRKTSLLVWAQHSPAAHVSGPLSDIFSNNTITPAPQSCESYRSALTHTHTPEFLKAASSFLALRHGVNSLAGNKQR